MHEQEQGGLIQHLPPFGVTWNAEQSESAAVRCSGPGGEAKCHLCVLSPPAHLSVWRDWKRASVFVVMVFPNAEMSSMWQSLPRGVQFLEAVAACDPSGSWCLPWVRRQGWSAGFTLWDPLGDVSCYCGWRKALRLGGVSPRDHCMGCKST